MVSDVVSHIAEQMARRPLRLFCSPLREEFLKVDCSILRKAFLCVSIAPPGYQAPAPASPLVPGPDDQLSDHEPYTCHDVLPDGSVCQATFPSLRALQVHRRRAVGHGFVAPESFLAVTNQCPWCNVVYASIAHCRRHIKKSLASHQCRGGGSVVPTPLLPVETLVCQKCGHETENVSDLQSHMVDHFGGKDFSAPWNWSCSHFDSYFSCFWLVSTSARCHAVDMSRGSSRQIPQDEWTWAQGPWLACCGGQTQFEVCRGSEGASSCVFSYHSSSLRLWVCNHLAITKNTGQGPRIKRVTSGQMQHVHLNFKSLRNNLLNKDTGMVSLLAHMSWRLRNSCYPRNRRVSQGVQWAPLAHGLTVIHFAPKWVGLKRLDGYSTPLSAALYSCATPHTRPSVWQQPLRSP